MQPMQMERAQVLKSFTLKFQQSNKCLWGNKRGRTKKEKHQELQDQDLLCFPHLEGRWIGGNVDLDLLSLFTQRHEIIMGGIEREKAFARSTMVGERGENRWGKLGSNGEEDPLIVDPKNCPLGPFLRIPGTTGRHPVVLN